MSRPLVEKAAKEPCATLGKPSRDTGSGSGIAAQPRETCLRPSHACSGKASAPCTNVYSSGSSSIIVCGSCWEPLVCMGCAVRVWLCRVKAEIRGSSPVVF